LAGGRLLGSRPGRTADAEKERAADWLPLFGSYGFTREKEHQELSSKSIKIVHNKRLDKNEAAQVLFFVLIAYCSGEES